MDQNDRDEANTVLALDLDEKVKQRIQEVLLDTNVVNAMYRMFIDRLLYDRNAIGKLCEHIHTLEREVRYNTATNYPWRE